MTHTLYTFHPTLDSAVYEGAGLPAGDAVRVLVLDLHHAVVAGPAGSPVTVRSAHLRLDPGCFRPEPVDHPAGLLKASRGEFWSYKQVERFFEVQKEKFPKAPAVLPDWRYEHYVS